MYRQQHAKKQPVFSRTAASPIWISLNEQRKTARLYRIRCTLWYVFPKLATVIENIANRMRYPDRLLVVQNFPPLHNAFVGKDVLPDHFALIRHFLSHFAIDKHIWYENRMKAANNNWFI